jgi:hypothetical protein
MQFVEQLATGWIAKGSEFESWEEYDFLLLHAVL